MSPPHSSRLPAVSPCAAKAHAPADPARRRLVQALGAAGLLTLSPALGAAPLALRVDNVTALYPVSVARIERPVTVAEVAAMVKAWPGAIGVGGGRFSMGGQVAVADGLHLDLRGLNQLVWLRADERRVRVQAGMSWRALQEALDPLGLAVHTMQSYANFTVGGSVSVNAHGRYVGHGPVGQSVQALALVLADGSVVEASREQHPELFAAAIGGYGAVGVIVEVELALAENVRIERRVQELPLAAYRAHFEQAVRGDATSVLHNADLRPPAFDRPVCVTWHRTDAAVTDPLRLTPHGASHGLEQTALWAVTELPGGGGLRRKVIDPLRLGSPAVCWLNREASLDVAELEPRTRRITTYALQEYFVPPRHFEAFVQGMAQVLQRHRVHVVNVSVRHTPADTVALLPWAREEVFSFVLYHKQRTSDEACEAVGVWTRELIDLALAHEGRYYLPYQLHATRAQFERAYPEVQALRSLKARVDPAGRFSNSLWARYL